jgi:phosphomannomutase
MPDEFQVTVVRATTGATVIAEEQGKPQALSIDADERGRVLFRDTVDHNKFDDGFSNCVAMAKAMIERASAISNNYRVESIKLKLGLDSTFGVVFIGDASLEASIELEIKRVGA